MHGKPHQPSSVAGLLFSVTGNHMSHTSNAVHHYMHFAVKTMYIIRVQQVHMHCTHMEQRNTYIRTRENMLKVQHATINTQVYFVLCFRYCLLGCLSRTLPTVATAWLSLVVCCLFSFSGFMRRREVVFLTAEHASRTSSSSSSLGGKRGRRRGEGEKEEGER